MVLIAYWAVISTSNMSTLYPLTLLILPANLRKSSRFDVYTKTALDDDHDDDVADDQNDVDRIRFSIVVVNQACRNHLEGAE